MKLSGTLGITVEELIALDVETSMPPDDSKAEKPYFEVNLPQDLEKALREYIQGEQGHSRYLDCLWGELYGSINANQWGGVISKEQAAVSYTHLDVYKRQIRPWAVCGDAHGGPPR